MDTMMNFLLLLSGLHLLLAPASAQEVQPCETPLLMSGGFSVMLATGQMTSSGKISYDAPGQKVRFRAYGFNSDMTVNSTVDQLMLFSEKVYYEIDWSRFSCKKKALETSYVPMQLPKESQLFGKVYMGSSSSWGMGLLVNNWYGELPNNGLYNAVFTEYGCIPLTFSGYTPATGWTMVSTFNWVLGNVDPMDYVPPFFCANAALEKSAPVSMFEALQSLAAKQHRSLGAGTALDPISRVRCLSAATRCHCDQ
ncbi:ependymin-2-like [Nelusetta ayraudi]|uniref:ependymin-2-like n=1 Tax=Nelusetta ayraudi TaxID=303726 RepID=UPI003F724E6E